MRLLLDQVHEKASPVARLMLYVRDDLFAAPILPTRKPQEKPLPRIFCRTRRDRSKELDQRAQ